MDPAGAKTVDREIADEIVDHVEVPCVVELWISLAGVGEQISFQRQVVGADDQHGLVRGCDQAVANRHPVRAFQGLVVVGDVDGSVAAVGGGAILDQDVPAGAQDAEVVVAGDCGVHNIFI